MAQCAASSPRRVALILLWLSARASGEVYLPGSSKYVVKLRALTVSLGELKPAFKSDVNKYTLQLKDGETKVVTLTAELYLQHYNLMHTPLIFLNGKKIKYTPLDPVQIHAEVNTTMAALDEVYDILIKDPYNGWSVNEYTYHIRIKQPPDATGVVTARNIEVTDDSSNKAKCDPPYDPKSGQDSYTFTVGEVAESVYVTVTCDPGATSFKLNGEEATSGSATNFAIEGAHVKVLAQCIYTDEIYLKGGKLQRTYMLQVIREAELHGVNMKFSAIPGKGRCMGNDNAWRCDAPQQGIELIGSWDNPKIEISIKPKEGFPIYHVQNGMPLRLPGKWGTTDHYNIEVGAGKKIRIVPLTLSFSTEESAVAEQEREMAKVWAAQAKALAASGKSAASAGAGFDLASVLMLATPMADEGACLRHETEFHCKVMKETVHLTFSYTQADRVIVKFKDVAAGEDQIVKPGVAVKPVKLKGDHKHTTLILECLTPGACMPFRYRIVMQKSHWPTKPPKNPTERLLLASPDHAPVDSERDAGLVIGILPGLTLFALTASTFIGAFFLAASYWRAKYPSSSLPVVA